MCRLPNRASANGEPTSGRFTWPPWVWPQSVSATLEGTLVEDEGFVGEQDDRRIVIDQPQRAREIIETLVTVAAEPPPHLIGETEQPERLLALAEPLGAILENGDVDGMKRPANALCAVAAHARQRPVPPVVVAQDRIDAERRLEFGERLGPLLRQNGGRDEIMSGVEITENRP